MKAAKEKTFWLKFVTVSLLFCAPTIALGFDILTSQNCAELSAEYGQIDSGESAFGPAIHAEKYDSSWRVASDSLVAPKEVLRLPQSLGAKAVIEARSQIGKSTYAIRQAENLSQAAQVDNLVGQLLAGKWSCR